MKKITRKEIKNAATMLRRSFETPFQVLNMINKNRATELPSGETVAEFLSRYGLNGKLSLDDLLNYKSADFKQVCRLEKKDKYFFPLEVEKDHFIKIGIAWYELVPCEYSIEAFFASINDSFRVKAERERRISLYSSLFEKIENKNNKLILKEELKLATVKERAAAKRLKNLIKALKDIPLYAGMSDSDLEEIANNILSKKVA